MLVIGFVLSLFVFLFAVRRFAPDWFTVHRFLQPNRGEVTKFVTHDVINPRRRVRVCVQRIRRSSASPREGRAGKVGEGRGRVLGLFKNKFRFCWPLFGCLARRERRAYPPAVCKERATTPDSQTAPALRGGAAPGHLLRCSSVTAHWRGCAWLPVRKHLAPRIWPGGAPAKIGSYF